MKRPRRRMPKIEEIEELEAPNVSMADITLADLAASDRAPEDMQPGLQMAAAIVATYSDFLSGKPSWVQSIALAELLAIWVCGFHAAPGSDPRVQERFRERMLRNHIRLVRELVQAEVQERASRASDNDGSTSP